MTRSSRKYTAIIEERLKRIEERFAHDAPDAWSAFQGDERGSPADPSRQSLSRSRRSGVVSDTTLTVPAGAFIVTDIMGSGAYLGIIPIDRVDVLGPTSPWAFLEQTRAYARKKLGFNITASLSTHEHLAVNAFQAGLVGGVQDYHIPPASTEEANRFINGFSQDCFTEAISVVYRREKRAWLPPSPLV